MKKKRQGNDLSSISHCNLQNTYGSNGYTNEEKGGQFLYAHPLH